MSLFLIYFIILLPLFFSVLLFFCKKCLFNWAILFEVLVVSAAVTVLGILGEQELLTSLSFMEEPITFSVSSAPVILFLGTLFSLLFIFWRQTRSGDEQYSRFQYVLLSLSLSFGFVSFISGQFMIRYIALDIVGLIAALTVLSSFADSLPLKRFIIIFQVLRLGDLSLLASILLINHRAGTLDISRMITAAVNLPESVRTWVFMGFFFAVLIKMAIWPFGLWLSHVRKSATGVLFWISGFLVPALGYYLLYRILPIIGSSIIFQNLTLYTGLVLFFLIILSNSLRLDNFDFFTRDSGLYSCFLLGAVAFGNSQYLLVFILGQIFYRLFLLLAEDASSQAYQHLTRFIPLLFNVIFIGVNLNYFPLGFTLGWVFLTLFMVAWEYWTIHQAQAEKMAAGWCGFNTDNEFGEGVFSKGAQWPNQFIEVELFSKGVYRFSGIFGHIADWVYKNIEIRLENLWSWIGQKLILISEGTLYALEEQPVERTGDLVSQALKSLERYEQNVLKKTLRIDLAWIPILLVIILIMLFVF